MDSFQDCSANRADHSYIDGTPDRGPNFLQDMPFYSTNTTDTLPAFSWPPMSPIESAPSVVSDRRLWPAASRRPARL